MFKKRWSRFSRRPEIDKDTWKKLQDLVLEIIELHKHLNASPEIENWTYKILKNTFINNYRKSVRHKRTFFQRLFSRFDKEEGRILEKEIENLIEQLRRGRTE